MADTRQRTFADRLRDIIDNLREALSLRQLAPVPIPARDEEKIIIRRR